MSTATTATHTATPHFGTLPYVSAGCLSGGVENTAQRSRFMWKAGGHRASSLYETPVLGTPHSNRTATGRKGGAR